MIGKPIFLGVMIGSVATTLAVGLGFGYFGLGKPRVTEQSPAPREVHAPAPTQPPKIAISGQFKKDLSKRPDFVLGERLTSFVADEEEQKSALAGGTIKVVNVDGDVVASGGIADNGTFALEIPPARKYIVRAQNKRFSVSYAVVASGLPDMKIIANAEADDGQGGGADHGAHGGTAGH